MRMNSIQGKENAVISRSPKSPNVLKPKPLSFRRKQKRLSYSQPLGTRDTNLLNARSSPVGFLLKSPAKCINPFKCIEKRKRVVLDDEDSFLHRRTKNDSSSSSGFHEVKSFSFTPVVPALVDENAHLGYDNQHFLTAARDKEVNDRPKEKHLPVDWSLKTKIRLTSAKPFPWRSSFKTSEEASGTTGFVRCLHPDSPKHCSLDSSHGAKFFQQCLVWIHPSIPWLNLFPRANQNSVSNNSFPPLDTKQQDILHSNWCDSFRSLYQLLRMCQCPFFYLCAPTFTILFRAGGVASFVEIHAIITPTTRGFRNALKEEGIEFTMPLNHNTEQNGLGPDDKSQSIEDDNEQSLLENFNGEGKGEENEVNNTNNDSGLNEDDEAGMWLESLGLSQEDFPLLNPKRMKMEKTKRKNIDHRPESLVFIEGSETQALVNFLLNYPSCTSKTGALAGVPPTLLSPVSFLGATLHTHKVRHGKVRENEIDLYAVELSGALLPNTLHSLCSLLRTTQDGNFSATLSTFQPTSAFAQLNLENSTVPLAFSTENLKDCGLPSQFIQQMCSKSTPFASGGISTIAAENSLFTWT